MNHCLIFDIGKTNKKCFVFDEHYRMVWEKTTQLAETTDEDGFACEDLYELTRWLQTTIADVLAEPAFSIRAVDVTTYGASLVHLDAQNHPCTPLYNYLKPFPEDLFNQMTEKFGNLEKISLETASPVLGNLNAGLQLYALKYRRPDVFKTIHTSLHLPQYAASVVQKAVYGESHVCTDASSLGCHTLLWDFQRNAYHRWAIAEGLDVLFPPVCPAGPKGRTGSNIHVGNGLHDSSAALLPYLKSFMEPFVLLSTGTWCIALNPFNDEPLRAEELRNDCLCYRTPYGTPVKASRFFGGHEHDVAVKRLAETYAVEADFFRKKGSPEAFAAYTSFIKDLVHRQVDALRLALGKKPVKHLFVDGGFSANGLFMQGLTDAFPELNVCAAEVAQATALGAAVYNHERWNTRALPTNLISLQKPSL